MPRVKTDIKLRDNIEVYNNGSSTVIVPTIEKEVQIKIIANDRVLMDFEQIRYVNDRTQAFKSGLLEFNEEERNDIYQALKITDVDKILFNDVIEDMIRKPTMEKLQRIIDIDSVNTIERVKAVMIYMLNTSEDEDHGISNKVIRIVNGRFDELSRGIRKSGILITPKSDMTDPDIASQDEVDSLKAQLAEMQNVLDKLTKGDGKA